MMNTVDTATRTATLRKILMTRRLELRQDVQGRLRQGRADRPTEVRDDLEQSDTHIQRDIELSLLQMRSETLGRIDSALVRLDDGSYGRCAQCAARISERRLRALPFAARCQSCEEEREQAQNQARQLAQRRRSFTLFADVPGA